MAGILVSLLVFIVMVGILCVPPVFALHMLLRRFAWTRADNRRAHLCAVGFAAVALLFNLTVATFFAPEASQAPLSDVLNGVHVIAFGLAWLCFWGGIALPVLVGRRRRSAA